MWKNIIHFVFLGAVFASFVHAQSGRSADIYQTSEGELKITVIGHGSLMFEFKGQVFHVDPYSQVGDYTTLPKADMILLTHDHGDHLDPKALASIRTEKTILILTEKCAARVDGGIVMHNGDTQTALGIKIDAIPAYNIKNTRPSGEPFHPRGDGNGYILAFGDSRVYVAGDTENTPEMNSLTGIDIAFLPMNLPYTMTPEMTADAAKAFKPKILYPYHYGNTDTSRLVDLLKEEPDIEVRIR